MAQPQHNPSVRLIAILLPGLLCAMSGCKGKSIIDDNPVFAEAPPRQSLTNKSTLDTETGVTSVPLVKSVSFENSSGPMLSGNSVVAQVNGHPIFVDDLIGSLRLAIESDPRISPEQRQQILLAQVKARLATHVNQEIAMQALKQAIPEDRRKVIEDSLEEPFQEVIGNIKKDRKAETDAELNAMLANEGLSVDLLRESFFRIQMVNGYLATIAAKPPAVDRSEMLAYYQEHLQDYTNYERVRWQEIVVLFSANGGRSGAEKKMVEVVKALQNNADFGDTAAKYSDALSAEKRGDMGWLEHGGLSNKELETELFKLAPGQMTKVFVRDDRFEVYRVATHEEAKTTPFQDVQKAIEQKLKGQREQLARDKAQETLRAKATVITIFDEDSAG